MKFLRITAAVITVLIILGLFLLPEEVLIEKSIKINANSQDVYTELSDLKKWSGWSPWHKQDPKLKSKFNDVESGKGAKWFFSSDHENVRKGYLVITETKVNEFLKFEIYYDQFEDENEEATFVYYLKIEDLGDQTKVIWGMQDELPFWNVFSRLAYPLISNGIFGNFFESGLNNLKSHIEGW